jgi:hypothetical protein
MIRSIQNPVLASKKLVDIAQSYGAKDNLAVLIVRFNFQKKIQQLTNSSHQRQIRPQTYSAATSSGISLKLHRILNILIISIGEHSPIASPLIPLFDSTAYMSGGEFSDEDDDEDDDSNMEHHQSNLPTNSTNDYLFHQSDQISSSSDTPATLNDSTENHLLSRGARTRYLATSLNDTSAIDTKKSEKIFQSDTGLFNFPASNAQPVRIIPSDLTIVSEILSTSPPGTLSRTKRIKNPSLTGDISQSPTRSGRYRKKLETPARPPLGYSKPPRTDFSSNSDVSNDGHDYDYSPTYPAGLRPVADAILPISSSDDDDDDDDEDEDFSYVVDQMSFASTNTTTDGQQQQQNELNSLVRKHYPSGSSTTHSTVNSTVTSSSMVTNNIPILPWFTPNKITRL